MKKILFLLLVTFITLNLQGQVSFLDYISEISCVENRKVDYKTVIDIKENKIANLSEIEIDFILNDKIYLLNKRDSNYLLLSKHDLNFNKKKGKYSFIATSYLLIDKIGERCYIFKSGTIINHVIKKVKKNVLYTNCIPSKVLNSNNTIWEIQILSNEFPYQVKYSLNYDIIYSSNEIKNDKIGDFVSIVVYEETRAFSLGSDNLDNDLHHNINKVSYNDFMQIISTLEKQIEEGKYRKYERDVTDTE